MKLFFGILAVLVIGLFGYVVEPGLRHALTGLNHESRPESLKIAETIAPSALVAPPVRASYDYSKLQPSQFPEKVVLKSPASATAPGELDALALPAGTKVKPVRIEGNTLVFSVLGTAEGRILVAQTSLVEQLIAQPPHAANTPPVENPPVVVPTPSLQPEALPAGDPAPVLPPDPAPAADSAPAVDPAPATTADPVVSAGSLLDPEIVKIMQENIRSGQIKEFTFDQVTAWQAGKEEEIDNQKYQTGISSYKAETIFGMKNIQAKALIQNGKVVRWIWPTSGLEIQ